MIENETRYDGISTPSTCAGFSPLAEWKKQQRKELQKPPLKTELDLVDEWLTTKHTTLWSTFNVTDPRQRREAAEWFIREMDDYMNTTEGNLRA